MLFPDLTNEEEIDKAVQDYIAKGGDFGEILKSHRAEVVDMCITEYNQEVHEENIRQEGFQDGHLNAIRETAINLYHMGMSIEDIAKATNTDQDMIKNWLTT